MKIKALIGIDGYSLMVCHCSGNLYHLSIIDRENVLLSFEGIYTNSKNAIARGRSIIQTISRTSKNSLNKSQ